jgi:hypothetical protein
MLREMLQTEQTYKGAYRRHGIFENLERTLKQHAFLNKEDALEYKLMQEDFSDDDESLIDAYPKEDNVMFELNDDVKSKIKSNNSLKWYEKVEENFYNVGIEQFRNITTPEVAYILGLLWTDGHISTSGKDAGEVDLLLTKDNKEILVSELSKMPKLKDPTQGFNIFMESLVNNLRRTLISSDQGNNIINHLTKNLSGMIFKDNVFIPIRDINFEWGNKGYANKPRLSILYKVSDDPNIFKLEKTDKGFSQSLKPIYVK